MSAKYMAQQAAHVRCATDSYNEAKRVISGCHMVRVRPDATHPTATAAADLDPRTVTVLNEVDTMMAEFHARLSTEAWDQEVQRRDSNCLRNPGSCCTPGCPNPPVYPCYGPPTIPGIHFRDGVELCFHKSCDECVERDAVRDADGIVERSESGAVHELWFCWCHQKSRHGDDCCVTRPACCSRGAHYGDVGGEHNVDGMCEGDVTTCTHSVVGSAGTTCLCHFCEKHRTTQFSRVVCSCHRDAPWEQRSRLFDRVHRYMTTYLASRNEGRSPTHREAQQVGLTGKGKGKFGMMHDRPWSSRRTPLEARWTPSRSLPSGDFYGNADFYEDDGETQEAKGRGKGKGQDSRS
jgi:hypothetical protein